MKIIAFCGIDGAGKTTQISILHNKLEAMGYKVLVLKTTFFPLYIYKDEIIDNDLICLSTALDFLKNYFFSDLEQYDYVLCDRYTLCHLSFAKTYKASNIKVLEHLYSLVRKPDITFYFDIDLEIAMDRIISRESKKQQFDEIPEILGPTLRNYNEYICKNENKENYRIIDANQTVDDVYKQIAKYI